MPIFLGAVPPSVPATVEPDVFRMSWTSPVGRVTDLYSLGLNQADFVTMPGVIGLDMPAFTPYVDTSPGFDGEIVRGFRTEARDIAIPVLMYADNLATFRRMRSDFFTDLNPRAGNPGTLTVTQWDGSEFRDIEAFYAGGLEGAIDDSEQGLVWSKAVISFRAPDPYWRGDVVAPLPLQADGADHWLPLYPIRVGATRILGASTITNSGQGDAFPTYRITGPATSVVLTNQTSGESLTLNYPLDSDDVLVINTQEGHKSVRLNGTTNLYPYLTLDSTLWALKPGVNEVNFGLAGQSSLTSLQFTYRERYLAAW